MRLTYNLLEKGSLSAESLLDKQSFSCDYCNKSLVLSNPKIELAYLGPFGGPIKEQWQFSFNVESAIEVGKKIVTERTYLIVLAHVGRCALKSKRRNEIVIGLSSKNESIDNVVSVLVNYELISDITKLWEDDFLLELPYIIWTSDFVYKNFDSDCDDSRVSLPRNPMIFEI